MGFFFTGWMLSVSYGRFLLSAKSVSSQRLYWGIVRPQHSSHTALVFPCCSPSVSFSTCFCLISISNNVPQRDLSSLLVPQFLHPVNSTMCPASSASVFLTSFCLALLSAGGTQPDISSCSHAEVGSKPAVGLCWPILCQLDASWSYLRGWSLNWENASTRLICRKAYRVFS